VFNNNDNTFTNAIIERIEKYFDEIEASTGPACFVSIGTGSRFYSTGFNLAFWGESVANMASSMANFQRLFARLQCLNVPTFAVINGHCYAGGLLFALAHDFRIMQDAPKRKVCLSELKVGGPLATGYSAYICSVLPRQTVRKILYAEAYTPQEALEDEIIEDIYSGEVEADKRIH